MLRIHHVMLDAISIIGPMARVIEHHDRDLGSQLKRAASSVALNIAEGSGSFGGVRTARYRTALGSARETLSCLQVAQRFGYVEAMPDALVGAMNHVIGTLVRVTV
jgi:four helix bundle protein